MSSSLTLYACIRSQPVITAGDCSSLISSFFLSNVGPNSTPPVHSAYPTWCTEEYIVGCPSDDDKQRRSLFRLLVLDTKRYLRDTLD